MSAMERTAWLFTKGAESVRIELRVGEQGVQLTIEGPGDASSRLDFPPGASVESLRQDYERKLQTDGYKLQVVAERRGDRRAPFGGTERRRQ